MSATNKQPAWLPARMFAVSCTNAELNFTQIAILATQLEEFGEPDFKDKLTRHFGLDFFDEFFWKDQREFREIEEKGEEDGPDK